MVSHEITNFARTLQLSLDDLLSHQTHSGAVAASPDFSQYGYCWLRDGSFIAWSLMQAGKYEAAGKFHEWCVEAIRGVVSQMQAAIDRHQHGDPVEARTAPPARFTLEGQVDVDDWPNFQIDGYGTWLWALDLYLAQKETLLPPTWTDVVWLTVLYIAELALEPCFDVWEENEGKTHTSTVCSVLAGLRAALRLFAKKSDSELYVVTAAIDKAQRWLKARSQNGWFSKSDGDEDVDASTIWLAAPMAVVAIDDPVMHETIKRISQTLEYDGGIRRYAADTYYGGGAWPVLTCSLGLYHARAGRITEATACLNSTLAHMSRDGSLCEQFGGDVRSPERYQSWVDMWGTPAQDLMWSHAMVVGLIVELENQRRIPADV